MKNLLLAIVCLLPGNMVLSVLAPEIVLYQQIIIGLLFFGGGAIYRHLLPAAFSSEQ